MSRVGRFLCCVAVTCIALPAFAEDVPVEFAYDEGTSSGGLSLSGKPLPVGTILATRFRPDHNFILENVQVAFWGGAGKIEVHVWRDNGGSQPGTPGGLFTDDSGADRIAPHTVQTGKNGVFIDVDLAKENVMLAATEQFWVGVKIVTAGTNVAVDKVVKDKTDINAILQTPDEPCADACGVPGNLLIRANGHYVDPLGTFWFTEIAEQAGIAAGGRMAFGDYDKDGDDDLLFGGSTLYRNDGKGHFEDVSAKAGLSGLGGSGGLWGDYDNDGNLDIFVFGGKEHLIRNQGDGTFKEVSPGMFPESADRDYPTEGALWLDADNDGLLDIYCANYEHVYKGPDGVDVLGDCDDDFLWHNNGNGTFTEVGADAGLRKSGKLCGRGPAAIDWDQDGDTDVFVNNYRLDPNLFWVNDSPLLHFTNIASKNKTIGDGHKGQSDYGHGTGAQWVDADNDGDFDLFGANLAHPRFIKFSDPSKFFRNDGAEQAWGFTELREATGIGYLETHSAPAFADFDNDGDMDLAIGAYYGDRMGQFWRNDGTTGNPDTWLTFSDVTYPTGWTTFGCASIAWADIDGDGDLDQMANNQLFRNDYNKVSGTKHHWLKVRLRGTTKVNRAAIGAWVTVATGDGRVMSRMVSGGQGLATQDSLTLHFGLGAATQVQTVTVHWPGLPAEAFGPFAVDGAVEIVEGKGIVASPAAPGDADAGSTGDAKGADGAAADSGGDVAGAGAASPASASSGCAAAPRASLPGMPWLIAGVGLALLGIRRRRPAG